MSERITQLASGLTIYYLLSTLDLNWEARSTGTFIGVILLVLCVVQFVRLGLRIARGEGTLGFGGLVGNTLFNRQRLGLLLLTAAFIALLPVLGTTVGLFIVVIAMTRLLGVRSWRQLVLTAGITAATVHFLLIYLLGSQLPEGLFSSVFAAIGI